MWAGESSLRSSLAGVVIYRRRWRYLGESRSAVPTWDRQLRHLYCLTEKKLHARFSFRRRRRDL